MYQALYRKWRPRVFEDVVGQEHITETLKRQVSDGRLSHAYLFTGTRGTGKTTCAKLLARAVNCEHPVNGSPCNCCPACKGIESGAILDVLELDAASNNRVDDIRALMDEAVYTPATVKKRVYIVDEVHMLSTQAFNALLQILEEPPEHLMFILATTEIHKVPATIKSRCQQFSFKRIHADGIAARLRYVAEKESIDLTGEGAQLIARLADGGMRDALSLLDQCVGSGGTVDEERIFGVLGLAGNVETAAMLECAARGDAPEALERLDRLYRGGKEMTALMGELAALVRDLLVRKTAPQAGPALMTGGYDEGTMRRLAGQFDTLRLVQMLSLLQRTNADLARSANRRTDAELCLMMLCDPTLDESPAGLSARLSRLEQGGVPAAVPGAVKAPEGKRTEPAAGSDAPVSVAEAPAPVAQAPAAEKKRPASPKAAVPSAPAADGVRWPGWPAVCEALRGTMEMSDFSFVGNDAMCQGRCEGDAVTLWALNDFIRDMLDRPAITAKVAETLRGMLGAAVRVSVKTGEAPADRVAPRTAVPAAPAEEEDALEAFLADAGSNIIVE
ncbi:MAG: DNA polymerase III subunit gamma/tau [Oscillospiraceae bacterium]|nr:DNA polymerase III subunit gamma/tau [Oscillospiraceae bacterium]